MSIVLNRGMDHVCRVLLVSGSLRSRSTNTAVLRTAQAVAPAGVTATVYEDLASLPHFNPDDDVAPLRPAVGALRSQIRSSDALCFSTPEYAGTLPGSFKNLLDWTIGDDATGSVYEKPVAWINTSPRGAVGAHESLRTVLGYAKALIVDAACAHIPVTGSMVADDGMISDRTVRDQIARALARLASSAIRPRAVGAAPVRER
jgi:chromate reductase